MIISGLIRDILVVLMLLTFWKKIKDWAYSIFCRRPLRTYLRILAKPYFLLTWVCLAVWYITVVQGCRRYPPGPYLEAFCLQPDYGLWNRMPSYLDPWNASNEHSSTKFDFHTKTILTSHLDIMVDRIALQQQALRLKDITPEMISTDDLSSSLGMSHVSAISIQSLYTPADYSAPDQVVDMVMDLGSQLDAFSLNFFVEKDTMTNTFRTFVEAYAMTITMSDYKDLNQPSTLLFPGFHLMRIINQYSLLSWLPEPKLYSVQVRAEIQFQKAKLIYELKAALDRVDASFPPTQLSQGSSSQIQCLKTAIDKVTIHQQRIRQMIDGSDPSFWRWIRKTEETVELERYYKLGERVRGLLIALERTVNVYDISSIRLRSNLQSLRRQTFERFPLVASLEVPPPLIAQLRNASLFSRGQSSRIDEDGDSHDVTHITSRSRASLHGLDSINDTRLSSLRSEIAQACEVGNLRMMGSADMYSICVFYYTAWSAFDDDPLSDSPTSWALVRERIIHGFEQSIEET